MLQKIIFSLLFSYSLVLTAKDTVLKLYRPYGGSAGQATPQIKKILFGICSSQSALIVREDAWNCSAGGKVYDPCFVKAGQNRYVALCPKSPWNGDSVLIKVKVPLNNDKNRLLDMSRTYPWAIELAQGERCFAIDNGTTYDNMPIRYKCSKNNYLVGHLQRCKPIWSMLEKTSKGIITVELSKAWF